MTPTVNPKTKFYSFTDIAENTQLHSLLYEKSIASNGGSSLLEIQFNIIPNESLIFVQAYPPPNTAAWLQVLDTPVTISVQIAEYCNYWISVEQAREFWRLLVANGWVKAKQADEDR
jgi:hypothetical protein